MGTLSDYAEDALLDHVLKTTEYTQPTVYVALSTADPTDDGSALAEPEGASYARKAAGAFDAASGRATANTAAVTFPQASGSWGTITHFALFDAITGGNMLAHGAFSAGSFEPIDDDTPRIKAGEIDVSFNAGGFSDYLADALLDHLLGTTEYTVPTGLYAGFSTADPEDDESGLAEPSGGSYARKQHDAWDAASGGASANTGDITFTEASGSWGTLTYLALFDAATEGNLLLYAAAGTGKAIISGQTAEIPAGDFDVTLD